MKALSCKHGGDALCSAAMQSPALPAFRLGDIRGRYPDEIDEQFARRFARAFAERFSLSGAVATGRDMRESSPSLQAALNQGFVEAGLDLIDMGLCPTELGYFASTRPDVCASVIVTASHNPPAFNGLKCVLAGGEAVTFERGLKDVMARMLSAKEFPTSATRGRYRHADMVSDYIRFLGRCFNIDALRTGNVALNGLNGTAATLAVRIADSFDLPVTWFRQEPGPFPEEGADPGKPRLAAEMKSFMADRKFEFGVAWDGDCDRCVLFDGEGNSVPTYYAIGLLAGEYLKTDPGRAIVFDTKLCWNTLDIIAAGGGIPVRSETGHAFVKQHMRASNAIYGGELSSHHFFGDFFHCDSGMFAWLKTLEVLNRTRQPIQQLLSARKAAIACTPEINLRLTDIDAAFTAIESRFGPTAVARDDFDGPSYEMPGQWRFSLRRSKTEALVRVNFECRGDAGRLRGYAGDVLEVLAPFEAAPADHSESLRIL